MILIVLLATMTAAAGVFGVLYVSTSSAAEAAVAEARAETDARRTAETSLGEAKDRAAAAEDERDEAKAAAQGLQSCQQAARDMLTALGGDEDDPATLDAVNAAIRRMADTCA
jgi:hypothetical protein